MEEYIGIDLGGTKILGVRINEKLEVLDKERILTGDSASSSEAVFDKVIYVINRLNNGKVRNVGIGVAGFIDNDLGIVHGSPNIPALREVNLKAFLQDKTDFNVYVDNDAKCGALAELFVGSCKNIKDFLFITFGTGIGSAIVSNGRIVRGKDNLAGEIGHITLDPNGPLCSCGKRGCFEAFASGPSIREIYLDHLKGNNDSFLLNYVNNDVNSIDTPLIFALMDKDEISRNTLDFVADKIGIGLSIAVNLLNPEVVVIGGGLAEPLKGIWDNVKKSFFRNTLEITAKSVKFEFSSLENDGVAIGSAILAARMSKELI